MVFKLPEDELVFPNPALAETDGLLAIGGDLSVPRLLLAYENGIFPWFSDDDPICWYAPHKRCVIYPKQIYISKSMRKVMRDEVFRLSYDEDFEAVIHGCAKVGRKEQPGTWITDEMQKAYIELHSQGHAHSVEVWQQGKLVGGLYGVVIRDVFCGESMFSLVSNASKSGLIWLAQNKNFSLIDCQLPNSHLMSLGAVMISQVDYMNSLNSRFPECLPY